MALLITNGTVLRPDFETGPADILIEGDRIVTVGRPAVEDCQRLDATGFLIVPGLVNAHTHAHNNLVRGRAENWTLEDLLNHGPAMNSGRLAEDQYLSALLGAIEMARTGCTAAYDLVMAAPAPDEAMLEAVVQAYREVGLRVTVAPAVADRAFYEIVPGLAEALPDELASALAGQRPASAGRLLALTEAALKRWHASDGGRIRIAVAPTIPHQCSDEFLRASARLADEYQTGFHTHLAESKIQQVAGLQRYETTLAGHLLDIGVLGPRFVGAHAVWLTDEDIRLLADHGAAIAHNPASNLRLGNGIAPVRELLEAGVAVGLGTDGAACSDNLDLFEAMRIGGLVSAIRFPQDPARWLSARELLALATTGSARVLGLQDELGTIEPGKKADLALVRLDSTFLKPLNSVQNQLAYAENGAAVDTVLVDGRVIVRGGRVLGVDEARVRERAQAAAEALQARNQPLWDLAERVAPVLGQVCRDLARTPFPVYRWAGREEAGTSHLP